MSLCVADIMMPEQEKVWPRLSDPPECCSSGVQPETSLFVCILVWHVIWFHLFIFIYSTLITFMALHLVSVLFLCLNYVLFNSVIALVKLRTGTTFSVSFACFSPALSAKRPLPLQIPTRPCGSVWVPRRLEQSLAPSLPWASTMTAHDFSAGLPKDRY